MHVERASSLLQSKSMVEQFDSSASEKKSQLLSGHSVDGSRQNPKSASSVLHDRVLHTNEHGCSSSIKGKSVDNQCSSDQPTGELLKSVLIYAHFFFFFFYFW